jgi:NAD-dependent dihydropyrimidine dehydrogenase PreA subunit
MTYVITEPCIGTKDQSCVEVCPVDCIYDAGDQFLINPEECIDCGACEPECPVEAIYPEDEVPRGDGELHRQERRLLRVDQNTQVRLG